MFLDILLLVVGLVLLLGGGDVLVRGAVGTASLLGVSTLIIGLTVVAFGTSAPELAVNLFAVYQNNTDVSFGNIIGSNIANVGLILGAAALYRPLDIQPSIVAREIPMMLVATAAVAIMAFDALLFDSTDAIARGDGMILLLLFGAFMFYMLRDALSQRKKDAYLSEMEAEIKQQEKPASMLVSLALLVAGLCAVTGGGKLTVDAAVNIAQTIGLSQAVIGLTVVAIGTSLPELATSVMAARRGHTDIAMGNVVGSNIFNLLLIMGVTATCRPIPIPDAGHTDLIVMAVLSIALLPIAFIGRNNISRREGALLLAAYVGYLTWRTVTSL
ncbi:calcium/sodium antiporter [Planctomycetales bacterium ZRK34]|nr:calcium/sodium antiporter [Planctomycetales bacterium ZRK34]